MRPTVSAPELILIAEELRDTVDALGFGEPVSAVYNPLVYAWETHADYLRRFGDGQGRVVLLGMNPGPWGMAQTGVPFGEVTLVRDWMGIRGSIGRPPVEHPKRPVLGFACERSEVSGRRLWGAIAEHYGRPEHFFAHHYVANYCPLVFMEESGRNRTTIHQAVEIADRPKVIFERQSSCLGIGAEQGCEPFFH